MKHFLLIWKFVDVSKVRSANHKSSSSIVELLEVLVRFQEENSDRPRRRRGEGGRGKQPKKAKQPICRYRSGHGLGLRAFWGLGFGAGRNPEQQKKGWRGDARRSERASVGDGGGGRTGLSPDRGYKWAKQRLCADAAGPVAGGVAADKYVSQQHHAAAYHAALAPSISPSGSPPPPFLGRNPPSHHPAEYLYVPRCPPFLASVSPSPRI